MDDALRHRLRGRHVLVVEDEYLVADDLRREFETAGARVVGPASTVAGALDLIAASPRLDAGVLDVNLGGEPAVPVALELSRRGVPFVFATGSDAWALPADLVDAPRCEKPTDLDTIVRLLFPQPFS